MLGAEQKFREWLERHEISYWYIDQQMETFSSGLRKHSTKRPDFMILVPHFGSLLVDIEDRKPAEKYEQFFIDREEVEKYFQLQSFFNVPVWFAFSSNVFHYATWFWIPVIRVRGNREWSIAKGYYSVPLTEFRQLASTDSLHKLFLTKGG